MLDHHWLRYFEGNRRATCAPAPELKAEVPEPLHAMLATSLGRFQLGESAGGRIHAEIADHPDPALTPSTRRSVQLYIEEEWRHAEELSMIIGALGGATQTAHWTNGAFTACRRLIGLRTKMLTLAVAEVVGIVYYRALADGVRSAALAACLRRIADEESRHLDFQAAFFARAVSFARPSLRAVYRLGLFALMWVILTAALLVLWVDHGRVLQRAHGSFRSVVAGSLVQLRQRRFLRGDGCAIMMPHGEPSRRR